MSSLGLDVKPSLKDIKNLDLKIDKLNNKLLKERVRINSIIEKINITLESDCITDDTLYRINKAFISYGDFFSLLLPKLFSKLVSISLDEYEKNNCVRENVISLIELVVVNDDFNYFENDDVLDSFLKFLSLMNSSDIYILSIINYLTDWDYLIKKVGEATKKYGLKVVSPRINKLCFCFDEVGFSLDRYQKIKFDRHK